MLSGLALRNLRIQIYRILFQPSDELDLDEGVYVGALGDCDELGGEEQGGEDTERYGLLQPGGGSPNANPEPQRSIVR